jgi:predicted ribosome quality control (RQC) complex YloA/Tae2 family protein
MGRIREDQEKRISGLQREQDLSEYKAVVLQQYAFEVQAIIDIIHVMQSSGIDWNDIARMVKEEQKAGNPLAQLIYKLSLDKNSVTLILDGANEDDEDQFANFDPVVKLDVDLHISAQMNIRKYFEIKKKSYEKELKTKTAANAAIRDAETHAVKEIVKHRQTQQKVGERMRKIFWFEKYDWFISSENYLIIAGKNA